MRKQRFEWTALVVCEIVFGILGIVFTTLGIVLGIFIDEIAASSYSRGDVYILPKIFGFIGIAFLIICIILFFISFKNRMERQRLIENGTYINACVTDVKQNYFIQINHRYPYYVVCEGTNPYTGETLIFKSANTMENPSDLLGKYLRVYIDYDNINKYYVELVDQGDGVRGSF